MARKIAEMTTESLKALLGTHTVVALVPMGSVEPHGPHLPLGTDTVISEAAILAAVPLLEGEPGHPVAALLAPAIPYGVTCFAEGFAGAISVPAAALTAFARAVIEGYLASGFAHVCLVNNHLEPAHDAAVRAAATGFAAGRASVACPLSRRWGRTLSPEFKSGACHAGRYETSLVLAAAPGAVDTAAARALPDLAVSLSDGIKAGQTSFLAMGLDHAYTGAPARASAEEGVELLGRLAAMIAAEVQEGLAAVPLTRAPPPSTGSAAAPR
jgi:creatinine amidohydrolase